MQIQQKMIHGLLIASLGAFLLLNLSCKKELKSDDHFADDSSSQIIGGTDALTTDPISGNVVAIYHIKKTNPEDPNQALDDFNRQIHPICTGFILGPHTVVTAAHCAYKKNPKNLLIYFGISLPQRLSELSGRRVTDYRVPTQYIQKIQAVEKENLMSLDGVFDMADIAVLQFEGDLPMGYHSAQIIGKDVALSAGMQVTLTGYGVYDATRSQDIYSEHLRLAQVSIENPRHSATEISMNQRHKKGSCRGDSGGPAYLMVDGIPQLIGITRGAFRDGARTCTVLSLYTSLQSMMTFLINATQEMMSN